MNPLTTSFAPAAAGAAAPSSMPRTPLLPRNTAIALGVIAAGGAVLLFLHADTRLPPDADALIAEQQRTWLATKNASRASATS